jgi:hypothetical protein
MSDPPRSDATPLASQCEGVLDALDALWSELRMVGVEGIRVEPLRPSVGRVTVTARSVGLYPEKLLWLLKESWRSLPEVRRARNRHATEEVLARLVTMCIEEYYEVKRPPGH